MLFKNQEAARLDTDHNTSVKASLEHHISYLTKQLKKLEDEINSLIKTDPLISGKVKALTSIPGVGIVLATNVICELPELGHAGFRQITSLTGLAPFARDSGRYRGKRTIFAGRSNTRKVLYMAAVASLRCNKRLKNFFDRLIANHKPPKVALVAVMRKLLSFMHPILRHNSSWSDCYAKI